MSGGSCGFAVDLTFKNSNRKLEKLNKKMKEKQGENGRRRTWVVSWRGRKSLP